MEDALIAIHLVVEVGWVLLLPPCFVQLVDPRRATNREHKNLKENTAHRPIVVFRTQVRLVGVLGRAVCLVPWCLGDPSRLFRASLLCDQSLPEIGDNQCAVMEHQDICS